MRIYAIICALDLTDTVMESYINQWNVIWPQTLDIAKPSHRRAKQCPFHLFWLCPALCWSSLFLGSLSSHHQPPCRLAPLKLEAGRRVSTRRWRWLPQSPPRRQRRRWRWSEGRRRWGGGSGWRRRRRGWARGAGTRCSYCAVAVIDCYCCNNCCAGIRERIRMRSSWNGKEKSQRPKFPRMVQPSQ